MVEAVEILDLDDRERWEAEHRLGGLPSQSWGYAWGVSASRIDPKLAIIRSNGARMLLPFFERTWMGATDVATIPGLSGASICQGSAAALLALWREYARSRNWVAGFIQLATGTQPDELPPDSWIVAHNAVFLFDLRDWDPVSLASRTIRRKVTAALRTGATLIDDPIVLVQRLKELYPPTMQRLKAVASFSEETLDRWARAPTSLVLGVNVNNVIEAVHLGHLAGEHAEWHIAATSENGRSLATLIYWDVAAHLRRRGVRFYNMGGGAHIGDGVYQFKERLGGVSIPLRSLRQVYNREKYHELCISCGAEPSVTTWFPAYRQRGRNHFHGHDSRIVSIAGTPNDR